MRRRNVLVALAVAGFAVVVAVADDRGLVLQVAAVGGGAVAAVGALAAARRWLPLTEPLEQLVQRAPESEARIEQLESLRRQLLSARLDGHELHRFVRPNIAELAAVRLARVHRVDLYAQPERARDLVGDDVWELVRPDRRPPAPEARGGGWSIRKLRALVRQLEEIS